VVCHEQIHGSETRFPVREKGNKFVVSIDDVVTLRISTRIPLGNFEQETTCSSGCWANNMSLIKSSQIESRYPRSPPSPALGVNDSASIASKHMALTSTYTVRSRYFEIDCEIDYAFWYAPPILPELKLVTSKHVERRI